MAFSIRLVPRITTLACVECPTGHPHNLVPSRLIYDNPRMASRRVIPRAFVNLRSVKMVTLYSARSTPPT